MPPLGGKEISEKILINRDIWQPSLRRGNFDFTSPVCKIEKQQTFTSVHPTTESTSEIL